MRLSEQTTVAKSVVLAGVGVHSGVQCRVAIHPAGPGAGIAFRRVSATGDILARIPANPAHIVDTRFSTSLAADGHVVGTVEHLMAALAIVGVDNAVIDVDAAELPILDGSAAPFVDALEKAGLRPLPARRQALRVRREFEITDGERFLRIVPGECRLIDVAIEFPDQAIGAQALSLDLDHWPDLRRLAGARTFCRLADVESLRAAGFSRGGSLDNAVVVDGAAVLNPSGLRDPSEFALHKALDLVGDLALLGAPLIGSVAARRPGHDLNSHFIGALLLTENVIERVSLAPTPAAASA
jgi:UDP-3-O-[3-hydroxymyristoyl] N-acetylglucosamine deacetylase